MSILLVLTLWYLTGLVITIVSLLYIEKSDIMSNDLFIILMSGLLGPMMLVLVTVVYLINHNKNIVLIKAPKEKTLCHVNANNKLRKKL